MTTAQTLRIRELNDVFRTTWITGTALLTSGIQNLPDTTQSRIAEVVQSFDALTRTMIPTESMISGP
ncbi:hypothetical protein SZ54_4761 [Rhizobium sp. UR51a]|nr:hypothetical protein BLX90_22860 [Rhizobium sp. Y9]KIV61101.1 hypothetical protein SZ54_4761 [Rhizobium sp. UR51a]